MSNTFSSLFKILNIEPRNPDLYLLAMTHSSFAHERDLRGSVHNERLEFLGDAVLELVISEILYIRFPHLPEGKLTRFRADMVREETLFKVAVNLQLGDYLRLGKGEAANGGRERQSLLADALEALFGAVYLDLGYLVVKNLVNSLFEDTLDKLGQGVLHTDYKTMMQECVQAKFSATPEYRIVSEEGPDHLKIFAAHFLINGSVYGEGSGRSKKEAEQEAARQAYHRLKSENDK